MKFKGATPVAFACALVGVPGHACSPERARWAEAGYWSDVCQAAMDAWMVRVNQATRGRWTGFKK